MTTQTHDGKRTASGIPVVYAPFVYGLGRSCTSSRPQSA
jgi:hypothetical protein